MTARGGGSSGVVSRRLQCATTSGSASRRCESAFISLSCVSGSVCDFIMQLCASSSPVHFFFGFFSVAVLNGTTRNTECNVASSFCAITLLCSVPPTTHIHPPLPRPSRACLPSRPSPAPATTFTTAASQQRDKKRHILWRTRSRGKLFRRHPCPPPPILRLAPRRGVSVAALLHDGPEGGLSVGVVASA